MDEQTNYKAPDRGAALVFALLAILVLSILAVAIMSTSQAQIWTALNYRLTAQARYAAETGVQETMNWLSSSSYTVPSTFTSYTMTVNPVQYSGNAVVLSAMSGVSSNYPDATVVSAYSSAMSKPLPGVPNASYSTYATLIRMTPSSGVSWLSGSGGGVAQTWQITSVGTINGVVSATVQVVETFERSATPLFNFGLEALATDCGSITMTGGDYTDSYNSSNGVYSATNSFRTGGNVATNGNVSLSGGAAVYGNIGVPNTTVGACPDGITNSSGSYLGASVVPNLTAPLPWGCATTPCYPPGTNVTTNQNVSTSCASISGCTASGTTTLLDGGTSKTANVFKLTPGSYGNITINSADVIHVSAGSYNINSINFAGDGQFVVDSGPVVFNLVGNCASGCPTESGLPSNMSSTEVVYGAGFAGFNACAPSGGTGVTANPNAYGATTCGSSASAYSGIPNNLQMVYGGTYTVRLGGMPNALVLYAPNAGYYTPGAPVGLFGSAIVQDFNDQSGSPFHYDTALQNSVMKVGQFRPVGGFSWSKF